MMYDGCGAVGSVRCFSGGEASEKYIAIGRNDLGFPLLFLRIPMHTLEAAGIGPW
jgi:hypothetical protein